MTTNEVLLSQLKTAGIVAVVRAPSVATAVATVDALVTGGVTAIELTFTIPGAAEALRRVSDTYGSAVLLGAGTIRTPEDALAAVKGGASFLVSPGVIPAVVGAMLQTGAFTLVGALTPTEVMLANDLGQARSSCSPRRSAARPTCVPFAARSPTSHGSRREACHRRTCGSGLTQAPRPSARAVSSPRPRPCSPVTGNGSPDSHGASSRQSAQAEAGGDGARPHGAR